ncbi:hypothetical protein EON63_16810, partial [archaeon]
MHNTKALDMIWVVFLVILVLIDDLYAAILRVGTPVPWLQSKPYLNYIRLTGAQQFLEHYKRCKGYRSEGFFWGDEIEYGLFYRSKGGHYDLYMNATTLREQLTQAERTYVDLPIGCEWQPEYGSWMIESVPRNPYGNTLGDLLNVEKSLMLRRKRMHYMLAFNNKHANNPIPVPADIGSSKTEERDDAIIAPSISCFPMLGVKGYGHTQHTHGDVCMSDYVSDTVINPHPRFGTLTRNIRERRGRKVNITVEVDSEDVKQYEHMDAMAFGMGSCCLQVTMQCASEVSIATFTVMLNVFHFYHSINITYNTHHTTTHHIPYTIHHTPYTIYHTPFTIHHIPYTIYHISYTIHHIPYTIYHIPYTIHHIPYTIHHIP